MANEVKINTAATSAYLRDSNGPVLRKAMVVGEAVKAETIRTLKPGFVRDFLAPRIVKRVVNTATGPTVRVGAADVKTRAHTIDGKPLAFNWPPPKGPGGTVFFTTVKHPGSDFSEYLAKRLTAATTVARGTI